MGIPHPRFIAVLTLQWKRNILGKTKTNLPQNDDQLHITRIPRQFFSKAKPNSVCLCLLQQALTMVSSSEHRAAMQSRLGQALKTTARDALHLLYKNKFVYQFVMNFEIILST